MLRELPLQLHDQLGFTVRGIRVVRANEMFFSTGVGHRSILQRFCSDHVVHWLLHLLERSQILHLSQQLLSLLELFLQVKRKYHGCSVHRRGYKLFTESEGVQPVELGCKRRPRASAWSHADSYRCKQEGQGFWALFSCEAGIDAGKGDKGGDGSEWWPLAGRTEVGGGMEKPGMKWEGRSI